MMKVKAEKISPFYLLKQNTGRWQMQKLGMNAYDSPIIYKSIAKKLLLKIKIEHTRCRTY